MIIALLPFFLVLGAFYYGYWKGRKLPPGPAPLPFFGNTLAFRNTPMDVQCKLWKEKYGDINTIWMGNVPVVTLHNAALIHETFVKDGDAYAGRPYQDWSDVQRGGQYGIALTDGAVWRENRRFALHVLRNFGLGRNLMQERVLNEVTNMIANIRFEMTKSSEVCVSDEVDLAVGSIINVLTFGYSFGKERQDEFQQIKKYAQLAVGNLSRTLFRAMEGNVEYYKNWPVFRNEYNYIKKQSAEIREFFFREIDRHVRETDLESGEEPNDYVEAFLRHRHKLEQEGIKDHQFSLDQLYGTVLDLWIAGQETTSNTLAWMLVYLMDYPAVQARLHSELDTAVGSDRVVTLDDKAALHYVNAVVAETQRYCNLGPFNLVHRTTKEVQVGGYLLPKDTVITNQICTVHMDERYFPDPEKFKPERFLDSEGKFFQSPELMPFGVGKRACLGESLARVELFLFAANFCNQFKIKGSADYRSPKRMVRGTVCPDTFLCFVENRF